MSNIRSFVTHLIVAVLLVWPVKFVVAASSSVGADALAAQTAPTPFDNAQYYLKTPNEKNAKPIDGVLVLDATAKTARFVAKGKTEFEIPYSGVTNLLYERTATPRYSAAVLISPLFLFSKSKKHFLTIQYKNSEGQGQFALIRLDKKNWQTAIATVEAQTGIKVERTEER
jgi:hypothetical protein